MARLADLFALGAAPTPSPPAREPARLADLFALGSEPPSPAPPRSREQRRKRGAATKAGDDDDFVSLSAKIACEQMKRLLRPLDDESVITATPSAAADSAYGSVELDCSAPELALANAISILADAMDEFNGAVRGGPRANETCGARLERILGTLLDVYVKRVDCGPRNIGAAQLELQKLLPGYLQIAAGLRHEEAYAHIAHIVVRYGRDMGQLRRPCGGRDATFGGVPATEVITRDVARRRFVVMLQRVLRVYTLAG